MSQSGETSRLALRLRRVWNWMQGKRILLIDPGRGRVRVRTGRNSSTRSNGGQWYLLRYDIRNGLPPLPECSRGPLERPESRLHAERCTGNEHALARQWYEMRHGQIPPDQELDLVCVSDPDDSRPGSQLMRYRPNEVFEVEHPWLSSSYDGRSFASYFATWYGSGVLGDGHVMDFERSWEVHRGGRRLPKWGASWR